MARGRTAAESWCAEAFAKLKGLIAGIVCLGRVWPRDIANCFALAAQFYIETTGCIGQQIVLISGAEALMERIRPGKCHFWFILLFNKIFNQYIILWCIFRDA